MLGYILSGVGAILAVVGLILWFRALRLSNARIQDIIDRLDKDTAEKLKELDKLKEQYDALERQRKELEKQRLYEQDRAREARDATEQLIEAERMRAAAWGKIEQERMEQKLKHEFELKRTDLDKQFAEYKSTLENNYSGLSEHYMKELTNITLELEEYQAKRAAINDAILRERELEEKEDFYRILIKENDIKDIEVLRSIELRLTNREVLNKLIYEVFIKRPLMEMEKRVLQGRKIGGIYKITYIKTGESYIGRSVDIGNRWKEHCLSSLNIGTIAHSTFHNILADKGLQNFTWEVLEEVDKDKQSSREKYWIDFYQTDKQYNQKAGG